MRMPDPENCKWVCIYQKYYMNAGSVCTYTEPWKYNLIGLTIDKELADKVYDYFIDDELEDVLKSCEIIKFESNNGISNLIGRKIVNFRREVGFEDGSICIEFSVCVEKTKSELTAERDKVRNAEYQLYLNLKYKFEGL